MTDTPASRPPAVLVARGLLWLVMLAGLATFVIVIYLTATTGDCATTTVQATTATTCGSSYDWLTLPGLAAFIIAGITLMQWKRKG